MHSSHGHLRHRKAYVQTSIIGRPAPMPCEYQRACGGTETERGHQDAVGLAPPARVSDAISASEIWKL